MKAGQSCIVVRAAGALEVSFDNDGAGRLLLLAMAGAKMSMRKPGVSQPGLVLLVGAWGSSNQDVCVLGSGGDNCSTSRAPINKEALDDAASGRACVVQKHTSSRGEAWG